MKQNNGYQKFFKEARQNSQAGVPPKATASSAARELLSKNIKQAQKNHSNPEQALKAALTERMKQKKAQSKAKKAKFPVGAAIALSLIVAGLGAAVTFPEQIEQLASKVEISFLGSAQAANAEKSAKIAAPKVEAPAKTAAVETPEKKEEVPDTRTWTPEELSFFNKLNERKQELDFKEAELAKLEEELQQQKSELEVKIQQLDKMRSEISGVLKDKVATDQVKVDKLVQVYAGMKPQQAARVIETINEDLAVEVLDKMKKKSASEILNMMDARKAQKLSEALAGYRQPATE